MSYCGGLCSCLGSNNDELKEKINIKNEKQTNSDNKGENNHKEKNNEDSKSVLSSMGTSSLNTNIFNLKNGSDFEDIPNPFK